ncbi:YhdT family protein [Thaumasiovibrio subtropicus]|uniref:YhdT family protein n=1 Tax=Thaumasiovibrio subtropicus TaxID=1891207 RepID=UPI000B35F4A6|nr:YhdT family protein [Thaumasiovibrio subtropicus]
MQTLTQRFRQAHKETCWAIALAIGYFLWWYISAYHFSPQDSSLPTLYFGLPLWFLLACVLGPLIFTLACALMVKFVYKSIPLNVVMDGEQENDDE